MAATRRLRRGGRRRAPRPASVALAGLITTAAIVGFIWLAENAYNGLPFLSYRTVYASLPNIGHLQEHDPVDIAGVRVGQVLRTSTHRNRALVELQMQGVGPLPINSTVIVRADGLLGERYVQLTPGTSSKMLPNNGTIVESNTAETYYDGIPETLNVFNAKTRTGMGQMLNGLGEGVAGRGSQLNEAIGVGPSTGASFDTTAYAILARNGGRAAANFLSATESGMTALSDARDEIAGTFHPAAQGVQPFISQRANVDNGLSLAPRAEQAVDYGLGVQGINLLNAASGLTKAMTPVLPAVPQALRSATTLLDDAPAPLRTTKLVLNEVPSATPAALDILGSLRPDLAPLRQAFTNLVGPVTSLAEHGCDIQSVSTGAESLTGYGTEPGGPSGVDGGFPISVVVSPQYAGDEANLGPFPNETPYSAPCAYSPGPTIPGSTMLQVLSGVFRPQ